MKRDLSSIQPRWWAAVMVVLGALFLVPAAVGPLWDADLGWMLRAGDEMLARGRVPHENEWSYAALHTPWVMHEWLLAASEACLVRVGGMRMLAWVRLLAAGLLVTAVWRTMARRAPFGWVCVGTLLVLGAFGGRLESVRPMGLALGLAAWVTTLAFDPRPSRKHPIALVLLAWVWASIHGSYPLALLIVAASLLEARDTRRPRAVTLAAMALATSLTPYGLGLHGLVARYLRPGADDATAVVHARIVEWWPLWRDPLRVTSLASLVLGLAVVAGIVAMRAHRGRALLVLVLGAMALVHTRHLVLVGVIGLPLVLEALGERLGGPSQETTARPRPVLLATLALPVLFWLAASLARPDTAWIDPSTDDEDVLALASQTPPEAKLFVTLPFAGWVVGRAHRAVYWDTRNDCYPGAIVTRALDIDEGLAAPVTARANLCAVGTTHALVYCDGRARRSLTGFTLEARRGRVCLLRAEPACR